MSEAAVPGGMRRRFGAAGLLSDDRLARRAVEGDERAFAAIFNRYHQDLYRYCTAILGNAVDAQDALQNTMVKVLRALPGEERRIDLKPWLYRIAHNESIELLRRRRPTEELDPELTSGGGGLVENAEARERLRRLLSDLDQLPDSQRGALVMRELAGLEFAEIAASLDTSEGVARQTLYEARLSLRQMEEGREMSCDAVARALSDADGRVTRRRDIRAHLRACPACRRFREELAARRADFAGLSPLPVAAAAGLLQSLLGGAGSSAASGVGLAGAVGGGAAKSLGAAAAIKSAAAVAVVAAVGVGAADRGGVVDVTPWDGGSERQNEESVGAPGSQSRQQVDPQSPGSSPAGGGAGSAAVDDAAAVGAGPRAGAPARGDPRSDADAAHGAPSGAAGHPPSRGHEKQHPAAAAHGQQTAAGHKAGGKHGGRGAGAGKRHGRHPKPTKPAQPAKPPSRASRPPRRAERLPRRTGRQPIRGPWPRQSRAPRLDRRRRMKPRRRKPAASSGRMMEMAGCGLINRDRPRWSSSNRPIGAPPGRHETKEER